MKSLFIGEHCSHKKMIKIFLFLSIANDGAIAVKICNRFQILKIFCIKKSPIYGIFFEKYHTFK